MRHKRKASSFSSTRTSARQSPSIRVPKPPILPVRPKEGAIADTPCIENAVQGFYPELSERVMQDLAKMVRSLTQRACQYTTMNVEERVRRCIASLAMEARAFHSHGVIKNAPTHSEIASLIGSNREAVSHAISALKKNGTIAGGRGRIRLINPEVLVKDLVSQ